MEKLSQQTIRALVSGKDAISGKLRQREQKWIIFRSLPVLPMGNYSTMWMKLHLCFRGASRPILIPCKLDKDFSFNPRPMDALLASLLQPETRGIPSTSAQQGTRHGHPIWFPFGNSQVKVHSSSHSLPIAPASYFSTTNRGKGEPWLNSQPPPRNLPWGRLRIHVTFYL